MRDNPKVCLEVDEIDDKNHWRSVVVVGRYEEIHDDPLQADARRRAERLFQERHKWWLPAAATLSSKPWQHSVIFRIAIDRLTGRRADRQEGQAWF
jgi:nitroimidazol reductase NimA-like FMN-containing flavoprotein (pyridoxamine 5'-phosphate oxidase superfamily)